MSDLNSSEGLQFAEEKPGEAKMAVSYAEVPVVTKQTGWTVERGEPEFYNLVPEDQPGICPCLTKSASAEVLKAIIEGQEQERLLPGKMPPIPGELHLRANGRVVAKKVVFMPAKYRSFNFRQNYERRANWLREEVACFLLEHLKRTYISNYEYEVLLVV